MTEDKSTDAKPEFVPWPKERVLKMYQKFLNIGYGLASQGLIPHTNWIRALELYCKIRGFDRQEEDAKDDAILVIPQSDSTSLWEELLAKEQDQALADAEDRLSTNTGVTVPSS